MKKRYPTTEVVKCATCPTEFTRKPFTNRKYCDPCQIVAEAESKKRAREKRAAKK